MDQSELNALFVQKLKELKESDPVRGRILEMELVEWAEMVPAGDEDSTWDLLYRQIRSLAVIHKMSEEQVIREMFTPGSVENFVTFLRLI